MQSPLAAPSWRAFAALPVVLLSVGVLGAWGCTGGRTATVTPRPLGRDLPVYQATVNARGRGALPPPTAATAATDSVSLRDAVALALLNSPMLATFAWETRAQEARAVQAGTLPNPVISVISEDVSASRNLSGVPGSAQVVQPQTTMQLSQLIELGGKRARRRALAERGHDLAAWDYETARMDVLTQVTHAFIDVLAAQESVALTGQLTQLVQEVQRTVSARVEAGDVSPVEESRANVALASAQVESGRAHRMLEVARVRLAAFWGASRAEFGAASGELAVGAEPPPMEQLTRLLAANPDLARWAAELQQREAALAAARAKRIPDLTLLAGYREFTTLDGTALLFGASFALPLFDRNAGSVAEEQSRVAKGLEQRRAVEARIATGLAEAYGALAGAYAEVSALRTTVLPGSRQTFEAVSEGYRLGRFSFLDVLDAQRTLIAASSQFVRARADYGKAVADVERLTGAPLYGEGHRPANGQGDRQ